MTSVMTVLGPVPADELGITLPHEHLQCDLARVTGRREEQLSDIDLAVAEVKRFRTAGGATVVDVTNRHLGRDPVALQTISRATGLHIVMGCGWYREPFYDREVFEKTTDQLADDIVAEVTRGVGDSGVRPGIIGEIGCDLHYVSPAEERSFRAAARAHQRTGLTITTHALRAPVGLAQLDLLTEERVDPSRVIVGHADTYPHPDYHDAVATRGAWVQFDTVRGVHEFEIEKRIRLVKEVIARGHLRRLLLSHDVCVPAHLRAYGGGGYDYLLTEFIPRLLGAGVAQEQIHTLTVENPRAALSGS